MAPMDGAPASVVDLCTRAYSAASGQPGTGRARWVMGRDWYDRLRAELVPEDQERERARAHADTMVSASANPPLNCPACIAGPFATVAELTEHVTAMADPANREPAEGDVLFGMLIDVRADGGEPHLETVRERVW